MVECIPCSTQMNLPTMLKIWPSRHDPIFSHANQPENKAPSMNVAVHLRHAASWAAFLTVVA
jgi:hypothetical protein